MIAERRNSICALGALAALVFSSSAWAQVRVIPASFTQAGSPFTSTAIRRTVRFDAAAPRSLASWVELHAGRFVAEQPSALFVSPTAGPAYEKTPHAVLRASIAFDLRPMEHPDPMVEPLTALNSIQQLPLSIGIGNALSHFGDRRAVEQVLGARGQGRLYHIGVKLDF